MSDELRIYWLAGLLEGEASFLAPPPSKPGRPIFRLPMTDRDIVERAAKLFGRAVTTSHRGRDRGWKPVSITAIQGAAAVYWMRLLRPLMGEQRRSQIDRALGQARHSTIKWRTRGASCVIERCARPVRTRGLCKHHYHAWWKAKKRRGTSRFVPVPPQLPFSDLGELAPPSSTDGRAIAWLAGLLEGEGTFTVQRTSANAYPSVSLEMTAEDVVRRAADIVGGVNVARIGPREETWSATYIFRVSGSRAAEAMSKVLPFMGERRSRRIELALSGYRPIRLTTPPPTCCVEGSDEPHEARGLCHRHYMSWHRDRKRGRTPRAKPLR